MKTETRTEGKTESGTERNIEQRICGLCEYAITTGLIGEEDRIYTANRLLELLELDGFSQEGILEDRKPFSRSEAEASLEGILCAITDYAYEKGIIRENSVVYRDLFDTRVMGLLVPRPGEVIRCFQEHYSHDPKEATDYYYRLSGDSNYIRRYRVSRDLKWATDTEYGRLDITINLSKPEKDPKAIAAARKIKQSGYPKCQLCRENEGYAGRLDHPARQNHRIIPLSLNDEDWYLQYSPYVYYTEHCIVFQASHVPMKIERKTFENLLEFVHQFPHYFVGSNADLPIVGGSILTHNHFQGGHYTFAMEEAPVEQSVFIPGYEDVAAGIVHWPMSVIRLCSKDRKRLAELADKILHAWRGYTDEAAFIYARTDGEDHNTITPIARKRGECYELDLVLRNNITTEEHPLGVYHPHEKLHHIKKENIGLIEVMGLAVLPARLRGEMAQLKEAILTGSSIRSQESIAKHADWAEAFLPKYPSVTKENIDGILQKEIGLVFAEVLEDAGVYKCTKEGREGFLRFLSTL